MLPMKTVRPNVFTVKPGQSILFGALGRLDYIDGPCNIILTLFTSRDIKVHKTSMDRADTLLSGVSLTLIFIDESPALHKWLQAIISPCCNG